MVEVKENEVKNFVRSMGLPVVQSTCPNRDSNRRTEMKEIIQRVSHINRKVRDNIYKAPWRINRDYLPNSLVDDL